METHTETTKAKRDTEASGANGALVSAPAQAAAHAIAAPAAAPRKGKKGYLVVASLAGALGLAFGVYFVMTAGKQTTDDAQVSADVVPVGLRVGGLVTKVFVKENQLVKLGEPLAEESTTPTTSPARSRPRRSWRRPTRRRRRPTRRCRWWRPRRAEGWRARARW